MKDTIEVPYYEFVIWYTGALGKKPDKIILNDFKISDFADAIVDSYGNNVFDNNRLAYDFYKKHKDDVVTITIEKMRGPAGDDGDFMNVIDFGDYTFYVDSNENFIDYYGLNKFLVRKKATYFQGYSIEPKNHLYNYLLHMQLHLLR